jgi:hypothetical protein
MSSLTLPFAQSMDQRHKASCVMDFDRTNTALRLTDKFASGTHRQQPPKSGQRPVYKDFSLTKGSTADSKSQARRPMFFALGRDRIPFELIAHASIDIQSNGWGLNWSE